MKRGYWNSLILALLIHIVYLLEKNVYWLFLDVVVWGIALLTDIFAFVDWVMNWRKQRKRFAITPVV